MNFLSEVGHEISKQTENSILNQLNDFIKKDLIVLKKGPMSFVQDRDSHTVKIEQTVELCLKDKEYIVKLEEENKILKEEIKSILAIITKEIK